MKIVNVMSFIVTLMIGVCTYAGGVGNGGFGLECKDGDGKISYQLYDYQEFTNIGLKADLGGPGLSTMERINFVLKRLVRVNPSRAARYRNMAKDFFTDQEDLESGKSFIPVHDLGAATIPDNCKLIQLAQQRGPEEKPSAKMKTYIVDRKLYKKIEAAGFTEVTAGLVIHEMVYNEHLHWQAVRTVNPTLVRYFNALISSSIMSKMTSQEFFMQVIGENRTPLVPSVDYHGAEVQVSVGGMSTLPTDVAEAFTGVVLGKNAESMVFKAKLGVFQCNHIKVIRRTGQVTECFSLGSSIKIPQLSQETVASYISFYDSGMLRQIVMKDSLSLVMLGKMLSVKSIYFDNNGRTEALLLGGSNELIGVNPNFVKLDSATGRLLSLSVSYHPLYMEQGSPALSIKTIYPIQIENDKLAEYFGSGTDSHERKVCVYVNKTRNELRYCSKAEEQKYPNQN